MRNLFCPSWLDIDLSAVAHNIRRVREMEPEGTDMIAVVKADAYGHGVLPIAARARSEGVKLLAVANLHEVERLREGGDKGEILVLGAPPFEDELPAALRLRPTLAVFTAEQVERISDAGGGRVHVKVETGMNRIGARPGEELQAVLDALRRCPNVTMTGIFSHLAVADEDREGLTAAQVRRFDSAVAQARAAGFSPMAHLRNTAAGLNGIAPAYDAVRLGIGLYGLSPLTEDMGLKPVAQWKTRVSYVKMLEAGERVGYGATYTAPERRHIATIAVGYADGYRRSFAPGDVLIRGKRAPIVGRICMDQCMVDVTGVEGVAPGDEVVLLGRQGQVEIPAQELAGRDHTIHYEVMTGIGARVERRFHNG